MTVAVVLLLSGCGGEDRAAEPEASVSESVSVPGPEPEPTLDPEVVDPGPPVVQELGVGGTAEVPGVDGGIVNVTLNGNVYLEGYLPEGEAGLPLVLSWTLANEGAVPARLLAPIEGGGWVWLTPDGQALDFYGNGVSGAEWPGETPVMHAQPVVPGTREENRINELVVPAPGGQVAYIDQLGNRVAVWDVPPQMSGSGYEGVLEVLGIG